MNLRFNLREIYVIVDEKCYVIIVFVKVKLRNSDLYV